MVTGRTRPRIGPTGTGVGVRVLHVVGGVAQDNRFGGVTRVAIGLARRQQRSGSQVLLAGAALGYRRLPSRVDGVRVVVARGVNVMPRLGLGAVIAPALLVKLVRPMLQADVVHIHLGRDVVSLTAALLARGLRRPLIVQTHGMLDAASNRIARLIDLVLTRPALRGASVALVLVDAERLEIDRLTGALLSVRMFPNGVDLPSDVVTPAARRNDVLFLARLHPRKGAVAFARAAVSLLDRFPTVSFRIFGPDEGDRAAVDAVLFEHFSPPTIQVEGAVNHRTALERLSTARILVLPAIEEPFGMTLIEAMAAGTPVVLHESAALAPSIIQAGAGSAFGPACGQSLEQAVAGLLDDTTWRTASDSARTLAQERFALGAVVEDLDSIYATARVRS